MSNFVPTNFGGAGFTTNVVPSINIPQLLGRAQNVFVNENGDTMEGDIDMNKNKITNLPLPTSNNEPSTKQYTDNKTWDGSSIATGTVNKDRLPGNYNSIGLNSNILYLKDNGDTTSTISYDSAIEGINITANHGIKLCSSQNGTYMNMSSNTIDFNNKSLVNISNPINPMDVANKQYVDNNNIIISPTHSQQRYLDYREIRDDLSPSFWISPNYHRRSFRMKDNTNNIMNIQSNLTSVYDIAYNENKSSTTNTPLQYNNNHDLVFNRFNSLKSTADYTDNFTFFLLAAKTKNNRLRGRIFTADGSNSTLGWWQEQTNLACIAGDIYGVTSNKTVSPENIWKLHILRNNSNIKTLWDDTAILIENTTIGGDTWNGCVVIGCPETNSAPDQGGQFLVKEVICFSNALTNEAVDRVRTLLHKYHTF